MGRSSRIRFFLCLGVASCGVASFSLSDPSPADAQRLMVRMPTNVRPVMRVALTPLRAHVWTQAHQRIAAQRLASVRGAGRIGPFARRNGAGLYGVGLGLSLASDLAASPPVVPADYGPGPEFVPPTPLPPCIRPQVIKIGLGARHDRPRVIYGPPTGCRL